MFLAARNTIRYNYIKHEILLYGVIEQTEISIFTVMLVKVL